MRTQIGTHLSVVDRKARVARVTVGACGPEERKALPEFPEYLLNGRASPKLVDEDYEYILAAQKAAEDCWSRQSHRDEVPVILKIDMPIVDMHIEAVKAAAIEATKALFPNEERA